MAIYFSFVDNEVYGTEDINAITKDLTGAGIAPFPTQESYNVSDLNTVTSAVVGTGVSLDGCKCTVVSMSDSYIVVSVSPGIIYFSDGARVRIDNDGYSLTIASGKEIYIYAYYSKSLQNADIVADTTNAPESGEAIILAEISAEGVLVDRRMFARSKVATFGSNTTFETAFTYPDDPIYDEGKGMYEFGYVEGVDLSKFNYALISYNMTSGYNVTKCYGTFNLMSNRFEGVIMGDRYTGYNQTKLLDWSNGVVYYVKKIDNRLVLYMKGETKHASKLGMTVKMV